MGYTLKQMTDILVAHLQVEINKLGPDRICSIGKQPGDSVVLDYIECGAMAWVRLVDTVPSINGSSYDITPDSCVWGKAHQMEMGLFRKSPLPTETLGELQMPTEEELTAAADAQYDDMEAMDRAIMNARKELELLQGTYTPVGPVGGALGGTWAFTLAQE